MLFETMSLVGFSAFDTSEDDTLNSIDLDSSFLSLDSSILFSSLLSLLSSNLVNFFPWGAINGSPGQGMFKSPENKIITNDDDDQFNEIPDQFNEIPP